jgi:hypothetical protein
VLDSIAVDQALLPVESALRGVIDLITERLRIARTLAVPANLMPASIRKGGRFLWGRGLWVPCGLI